MTSTLFFACPNAMISLPVRGKIHGQLINPSAACDGLGLGITRDKLMTRDQSNPTPFYRSSYGAYLASREWALKKAAIEKRSGGKCERCRRAYATEVHHRTYEHLYAEPLEDLIHICRPCHEYESGKSDIDPANNGGFGESGWADIANSPFGKLMGWSR